MPQDPKSKQLESATKLVLILLFLVGILAIGWLVQRSGSNMNLSDLSLVDLTLIALATFRLSRMIAFDRIMDPLRTPFTKVVNDNSGEGKTIAPRGTGVRQAIGQLLSCPTCIGTWVAAILVFFMLIVPDGTRVFLYVIAAVGLAEIFNSLTEALCWAGRSGRTMSGLAIQKRENLKQEAVKDHSHGRTPENDETDLLKGIEE